MREILLVNRKVKEARISMGMTQKEVAEALGVRRPAIAEIEAGKRKISSEELVALADLFGYDISYFVAPKSGRGSEQAILTRRYGESLHPSDRVALSKFRRMHSNYRRLRDLERQNK